ncbi:MAG: DUF3365 domain-containing protein [Myxococcota bacterium]|nr:DUF3365 domain-containing protein [Myxococcota bacterium]
MWWILALACNRAPAPQAPEPAPVEATGPIDQEDPAQRAAATSAIVQGDAAIKKLGSTLKARVVEAMQAGGPTAAIPACQADAPTLTAAAGADNVKVGRSSLKLRNPANDGPPWVTAWLKEQDGKRAAAVKGSTEVVDGTVRMVRPIPVEPKCLACHGGQLAPETQAALSAAYPQDQATGYNAGDLRGAIWAEVKIQGPQ